LRIAVERLLNEDMSAEGKSGNPLGNNQYGTFDNIQGSTFAPTGTSKHAGLRRLNKEVAKAKGTPKFEQVAELQERSRKPSSATTITGCLEGGSRIKNCIPKRDTQVCSD